MAIQAVSYVLTLLRLIAEAFSGSLGWNFSMRPIEASMSSLNNIYICIYNSLLSFVNFGISSLNYYAFGMYKTVLYILLSNKSPKLTKLNYLHHVISLLISFLKRPDFTNISNLFRLGPSLEYVDAVSTA
ncbi:unnamed protein product [Vicia faba]|uniref:Uncharacterized protein n=1 Tax=Vicia faba TaxID=3906 RepID=A0AAV1BC68_VICFA|nr:unnamed protein product [Vicia faba]